MYGVNSPPANGSSQRSRNGCLTCRRRKIKCDEQRPVCENCEIGPRQCLWAINQVHGNRKRRRSPQRTGAVHAAPSDDHTLSVPTPSHITLPIEPPSFERAKIQKHDCFSSIFSDSLLTADDRVQLMSDPEFLQTYFPQLDERLLVRHYLTKSVHVLLAYQSTRTNFNPWITVHAPLAFRHPPGVCAASDALRAAMVAVAAVQLRYSRHPDDHEGALRITRTIKPKVLQLVNSILREEQSKADVSHQGKIDIVLSALLSCTLASSLAADDGWHELLKAANNVIGHHGGPEKLLRDSPRDYLSPTRFVLEQFAVRDAFGCIATGMAPILLKDAFTPWFFEAETWSKQGVEWETVDRGFGISRGIVDLIARTCSLVSVVRASGVKLSETDQGAEISDCDTTSLLPDSTLVTTQQITQQISNNSDIPTSANRPNVDRWELQSTASGLMAELQVWDEGSNFAPLHPRVQFGNHCYRYAMRIIILHNVYSCPAHDERISSAVQAILELGKELFAHYGIMNWMTWPLLIAGFHMDSDHPGRESVISLIDTFGQHACFDTAAALRMLSKFWHLRDSSAGHALDHWQVSQVLGQIPFLD